MGRRAKEMRLPVEDYPLNYEESRVPPCTIPSPLRGPDGRRAATAEEFLAWRRPAILDFYAREFYGAVPPMPTAVRYELLAERSVFDDTAVRREVRIVVTGPEGGEHSWIMLVYLPKDRPPMPVFCGLNFVGNHGTTGETDVIPTGLRHDGVDEKPAARGFQASRWPFAAAIRRGYAVATACYHDIFPDFLKARRAWKQSIYATLFPKARPVDLHRRFSAIGAWAWALSRMLDALETDPRIDARRAAVIGHSRLGKTALWAGATDERFKLVVSNCSGHGGAALIRRFLGETNALLYRRFPHWFVSGFRKYGSLDNRPFGDFDQNFLIALQAPRAVCVASATEDLWADPKGEFLAAKYASDVYELFGSEGLRASEFPAPDTPVYGDITYHCRTGEHDITLADWEVYWNAADRLWGVPGEIAAKKR